MIGNFVAITLAAIVAANATDAALNATDLANAYYENPDAVKSQYNGQTITISGVLRKQDKNGDGEPLLLVGADAADTYVGLLFVKRDMAMATTLPVGSTLTVQCTGAFGPLPAAKDCQLMDFGAPT